jgi:sec-independent protein translocase protein TatA
MSGDMLIIGLVALLLFGRNLPTVARNVGRTIAEFKRAAAEATSEIKREMDDAARAVDLADLKKTVASPASQPVPDTATPGPRVQPAANTVAYTPQVPAAKPPAVSAAAALDTFRLDVKPPTKIPPPV